MALPRSVLLIITGSVASYKALELIRLMRAEQIAVTAILTKGGGQFITPLAVSSLTGTKTYDDLWSLTDETEMGHIQLSRVADLVLVAPASADILAKMANGQADDLATTALLATNKPVVIAPAMNHKMWSHASTQRNVSQLVRDGVHLISPTMGEMACGETGIGRMAEPAAIMEALATLNKTPVAKQTLKGKRVIVTSGPTVEAIDPVRYLGNRSSGKQGHAIAEALAEAGAYVTLISGSVNIPDPKNVQKIIHTGNAEAMLGAVMEALPADIFVGAAAVADWRLAEPATQKLKKKSAEAKLTLELVPTVDILAQVGASKQRPQLVVGFAAETEKLMEHARAKRLKKGCDWLIANEVGAGRVFGADDNTVTLITESSEESWPLASKHDIATRLAQKIGEYFVNPATRKGKTA
ncbi:MAG: bifunctional phosphopantothenoylcysteine decarboxylase/phosphopantothenate--cysteine ligase CoaBC [Rickettsiales bacterium]